ncbi:MAG: metal ABC transporter substrate-binding protein [Oscillospiraceae bacterium]|nr:metal ABC transporter substrate-binding protein [Oscillospiraceae bacterium]
MRKKTLLTAVTLCLSVFTGCTQANADYIKSDELSIVTTCFPPYDFARAVKGNSDNITMLLCAGAEAHSYEPTPLDILKIQQCDVFIYIGGEGEVWADEILESMDTSDKYILKLSDYAELLDEIDIPGANSSHEHHHHHHDEHDDEHEEHEEHEHDEGEEEHECEFDEHIWTSPENAVSMVQAVCDTLCSTNSEKSSEYKSNTEEYINKLNKLDCDFREMISEAPDNLIVMGDRFPFRYLADEYGLEYYSAFSGCSSETEPGVYTMAFLIDRILENNVKNVFCLEFSTRKVAEKLSDATGAEILTLHSCNNVSKEDFKNNVTYIDLMYQNLNSLKEALY